MDANSSWNGTDLAICLISMKLPALSGALSQSLCSELDKPNHVVFV